MTRNHEGAKSFIYEVLAGLTVVCAVLTFVFFTGSVMWRWLVPWSSMWWILCIFAISFMMAAIAAGLLTVIWDLVEMQRTKRGIAKHVNEIKHLK